MRRCGSIRRGHHLGLRGAAAALPGRALSTGRGRRSSSPVDFSGLRCAWGSFRTRRDVGAVGFGRAAGGNRSCIVADAVGLGFVSHAVERRGRRVRVCR